MKNSLFKLFMGIALAMPIAQLSAQQAAVKKDTVPVKPATATPAPVAAAPVPTVVTLSGFVRADYFYDSRQTVNAREGHVLFVPAAVRKDAVGSDINANPEVNMLAIQSRLKVGVTGPEFFGYKTAGAIEAEFLGVTNSDVNGLRLRHAFMQLTSTKSQITMGQTWHPFFSTDCFPGTYSFSTGSPFATFDRVPQFKLSSMGKTKVFAVLATQRDFKNQGAGSDPTNTTVGANGFSGLSLSGIPELNVGVAHSDGGLATGATISYKTIKPSLANGSGLKTDAKLSSFAAHAYLRYKKGTTTFRLQTVYGQNLSDMLMVGGYGIKDSLGKDPSFTPLASSSTWAEIEGGTATLEWGIFAGYSANLGFSDNLKTTTGVSGFLTDIKDAIRIAPRIGWKQNKTRIGVELEYTAVTRGTYKAGEAKMTALATDAKVSNVRLLVFGQYNF